MLEKVITYNIQEYLCKKVFFLCILFTIQFVSGQNTKINGISFVSSRIPIDESHVNPVVKLNANYAAIMPFGFMRNKDQANVAYNNRRQWFGETINGAQQYAQELQKKGIKIMMKPQLWIAGGEYTGFITMNSEDDWQSFEESYTQFILEYARIAQDIGAEIFCVGTELEKFVENRPQYWSKLIDDVRKVFKGKLTYASNWDEFKRTPFWNKLDYIGVDAYFPISDLKTPSVEACVLGWQPHKEVIKTIYDQYKIPVLFTEFGYRSVDYSAREPWRSDRALTGVNLQAQVNTTKAVFETFWDEDWFAGGFVWKWYHNYESSGGVNNSRFTPQNKPVEDYLRETFKIYK